MKKWNEFIENVAPIQSDRDYLKQWFKNAKTGVKNEKGLVLFCEGIGGKTTFIKLVISALNMSEFTFFDPAISTKIDENAKLIVFNYDKAYKSNYIKFMIDKHDSNILVCLNQANNGILKRCHTVIMPEIEIMLRNFYTDMLLEKESIRDWFLK